MINALPARALLSLAAASGLGEHAVEHFHHHAAAWRAAGARCSRSAAEAWALPALRAARDERERCGGADDADALVVAERVQVGIA